MINTYDLDLSQTYKNTIYLSIIVKRWDMWDGMFFFLLYLGLHEVTLKRFLRHRPDRNSFQSRKVSVYPKNCLDLVHLKEFKTNLKLSSF